MSLSSQRRSAGIGMSLLLLVGCNASQTQNAGVPTAARTSALRSSAAAGRHSPDLLYVANRKDRSIDLYDLASGKLHGRLSNVPASGMCANANGAVFVTNGSDVMQYARGGTHPISVVHDALGAQLQACAADAESGDLAVANAAGRVIVFAGAKGNAHTLADDRRYSEVAYDGSGDLFVARTRAIRVLPKGAIQLRDVVWSATRPARIGAMQWDGRYLAIETTTGKANVATLSRYAVDGTHLSFVDSMTLENAALPLHFAVYGEKLVAPAIDGVAFYGYPQGGRAVNAVRDLLQPQLVTVSRATAPEFAVVTYHDDNYRTGWDDQETALNPSTVSGKSFGMLATVPLDDQVDAQPLVVPGVTTTRGSSPGQHDVVYVATENDSVYAIDASSGQMLFSQSLGTPVQTPLGCTNNGPNVGITGTPVIDLASNVMYVIAYTTETSVPTYRIHELSLSDLSDVVPPVVVAASQQLTNSQSISFNATYQRQRPALLEANGNVYAGFGSFCDYAANNSRGWLLGWQTGTLTPLSANELTNRLATSPNSFFLSAIWMSGYGPATDASGNVYFVTGNSDYSGNTYNGVTNVNESVVKLSPDLTTMLGIFTPSNVSYLDQGDEDFGSGGVLVLPSLPKSAIPLAAAAGKDGNMYVMNQNDLGGFGSSNNVVAQEYIGGCWCGQSYYARKNRQRIVSSGGSAVMVWDVKDRRKAKLSLTAESPGLPGGQDPGFFTSISSDTTGEHAIIWALARPSYVPGAMSLYAFQAQAPKGSSQLKTLYETSSAGYWAASNNNASLVPTVANGKVYVASYKELTIFGLGGKNVVVAGHGGRLVYRNVARDRAVGRLSNMRGSLLTLQSPSGATVIVDDRIAVRNERVPDLVTGRLYIARGRYDVRRVLHATTIVRAKPSETLRTTP